MSNLVQITQRSGIIKQVKRGTTPLIELLLEANQSLVSVELRGEGRSGRRTVDWYWIAYVATTIEPA